MYFTWPFILLMGTQNFIKLISHPLKFRMFLFYKLPAAFFSGLKIIDVDDRRCSISVPFKWFTQNPFHSTYFATLAMAAEMSTGMLAMMNIYKRKPSVSMLILKMEASYFKKAIGKTVFLCEEGKMIAATVEEAITTGVPKSINVKSTGKSESGEVIAEFLFTWSFKVKANSSL